MATYDPKAEQPGQPAWKAVFMRRLQSEGRWNEASQRRVALENEGIENEEAWLKVYEEFPRLGADATSEGAAVGSAAPSTAPPERSSAIDLKRDVQWTYSNFVQIDQGAIGPSQAPSSGAWGYALWALANRTAFFKDVVPKVLKLDADSDNQARVDDMREQFKLLDIFEREEMESRTAKEQALSTEL